VSPETLYFYVKIDHKLFGSARTRWQSLQHSSNSGWTRGGQSQKREKGRVGKGNGEDGERKAPSPINLISIGPTKT